MPEIITCPGCQRPLRLPARHAARRVQCPLCLTSFPVSGEPAEPPADDAPWQFPGEPEPFLSAGSRPAGSVADDSHPSFWAETTNARTARTEVRRGRERRTGPLLILTIAVGIAVVIALGLDVLNHLPWADERGPANAAKMREQERQEVVLAFRDPQPIPDEQIARELTTLFNDLGQALDAQDSNRVMAHFAVDRLYEEFVAQSAVPQDLRQPGFRMLTGLREGMGRSLTGPDSLLRWSRVEIRSIKLGKPNEAVVIARHRGEEAFYLKMRWWVTRRLGKWQVYDMEDLDVGLRVSILMGSLVEGGLQNVERLAGALQPLRDALVALAKHNDTDAAARSLEKLVGVKLPRLLEPLHQMTIGMVRYNREQYDEALQALEKARQLNGDMPLLDFLQGLTHNRLGKWEQALTHLRAYHDLLGDDAALCRELGLALRGHHRFVEAAASYRTALDLDPRDADAFVGLLDSLGPGDAAKDIGPRFARLDLPHDNFAVCAENCTERRLGEILEQLALAMQKIDPGHAPADFHLALAYAWTNRAAQAVPLFTAALKKTTDPDQRGEYVTAFLDAMAETDQAVAAYEAVPDAREAFRVLAAGLTSAYRTDDLRQLIARHASKHTADLLLPFYRGELHVQEGRYRLAEQAFAEGMRRPPDPVALAQFRASRVTARYHTGAALAAYEEIRPRHDTFLQLANLSWQDEDAALLQSLLEAHGQDDPYQADIVRFQIRLKVRQGKPAEAVALFQTALAKHAGKDIRSSLTDDFLHAMLDADLVVEAYRAAPDAREAFQTLADELLDDGRRESLRRLIAAHRQGHADDVWLLFYAGQLAVEEKAWEQAAQLLGEGRARASEDDRQRFHWGYQWAMAMVGRAGEVYAASENREETFSRLANTLVMAGKDAELQALIEAHRPHGKEQAALLYYEARSLILRKRPETAIPLFQQACQRQTDEYERRNYVAGFLHAMDEAGQALEAYRAAPDRPLAFKTLASSWTYAKKADQLERLLDEHARDHADDPWCDFYRGEWHLLRGEAEPAAQRFAAALARAPQTEQWSFNWGHRRALAQAGKVVETYRQTGPGSRAFQELAQACQHVKDGRQLAALVAAHREAQPDDPGWAGWQLEALGLQEDHEATLRFLTDNRQEFTSGSRFEWSFNDRLVRTLVKLKRTEEAIREAQTIIQRKRGNRLLLVLAHAAAGDVAQAIAAVAENRQASYFLESCYEDPDLGPLLRSEAFGAFRARFPEPPGEDAARGS